MMNLIIRLVIGACLAAVTLAIAFHLLGIPPDRYLPASMSYQNMTAKTIGVVSKTQRQNYEDHWWAGMQDEYYVCYSFQPTTRTVGPNGAIKSVTGPASYSTCVRITEEDYNDWNDGLRDQSRLPIQVLYDPMNPMINGVPKTVGVYSTNSGFIGMWMLYVLGFLAVTIIYEEILKRWLPSYETQ